MARPEPSPTAPSALGAVLGGFIAGAIAVAISISFAALIFRDALSPHLPIGLGLTLVGSAILGLITAWRSEFPFAVAGVQDSTSAILAVAVSATVVAVGTNALPTTVALIATATVVMGVVIFLVGQLRLGEIARFMPFPVIGGFLVATGFLLIQGAAGILGRGQSGADLLRFEAVMLWVPGLVIGGAIFAAGRWLRSTLATPVALLVVTIAWRVGMVIAGVGADEATARGWLLGPFPTEVGWNLDTIGSIADADWGLVADAWLPILSIALVSAISLILHVHALEHVAGMDVDGNRELRIGGLAGIAAGAAGGLPGFIYFSDSSLLYRFGGRR
ncbi:MAG TPA: SulP family inorganic anion transporter, partial [Acidimicrobiia bacterium]|nr:SulP family inorganic anion transporter [Acidimicrobiia bacterium]